MTKKKVGLVLPAIRGIMGDWVYYSCLIDLRELSIRVRYAEEVHKNQHLSDMIQRQLKTDRSKQIAEYLRNQPERFFNSLVVATYGGQPNWHALSDIRNKYNSNELRDLSEETVESVGFLTLQGDENLFALDGQHRLAGIKEAVKQGLEPNQNDDVSVIFVAHIETDNGLERTRRLFTTLNKTAKPVTKGEIIALDEDDVMALCVRRLIEETDLFSGDRIAFVANNNMPMTNSTSLTTIGNLYDILTILFTNVKSDLTKRKSDLQRVRPNDDILEQYFDYSENFISQLGENFKELDEFFTAKNTTTVVKKYRGSHGGNAIFRPIGLEVFTRIIAQLTKDMALTQAIKLAAMLPRNLSEAPYEGLMWASSNKIILNGHKATLREILLYMVKKNTKKYSQSILLERYRKETGDNMVELPDQLI